MRAFRAEEYILEDYEHIIDENLKNLLINSAAKQQFQQRLQFLNFVIIVPAIILSVADHNPGVRH